MSADGRIVVETPPSESSRHRVEPRMFDRLDAIRAAERAADIAPDRGRTPRWSLLATGGALAVAAIAIVVVMTRTPAERGAATPSRVVTPIGGASRFTIDDAVIEAGSDTSVEVQTGDGGAVTLLLARGSLDCEVAARNGRPFRVVAGDVEVIVVGTRFTVARSRPDNVRVDVTHGKVRVRAHDHEWFVSGGERWPEVTASAPPIAPSETPAPDATEPADVVIDPVTSAKKQPVAPATKQHQTSPHDAFLAAQRREPDDWSAAANAYRVVAKGDDRWAALALYSLAELETTHGRAREALAAVDEYARRFPRGASAEDAAWLRVEALRSLGRADEARAAAGEYVRQFPTGTYAKPAARIASPP